ncbi:Protein kinase-like domain containing protein [Lactarius tabidus]
MARDATEGSVSRQTLVQLGDCTRRGQFGAVSHTLNLNMRQMIAVKKSGLNLMREVDLVKRLSHPSIVKYEGMARDENTLNTLLDYVFKILEGLDYLHRSDVVHCDFKAGNILTTKTGNVELSDFGVSLNLRAMVLEIKDVAGTPNWMTHEVIELKSASIKLDLWSLECAVIESIIYTHQREPQQANNNDTRILRERPQSISSISSSCAKSPQSQASQSHNRTA